MQLQSIQKKRFYKRVFQIENPTGFATNSLMGELTQGQSQRSRRSFVQMALKQGFLSPNPKPSDKVSIEIIGQDQNSVPLETWRDLCESEYWFYAACIRPFQTRYFMFCFDYGVVMYSKKQNQAAFVANEDIATKGPNAFARWNSTTNKIEMLEPIEREYVAIPSDSHFLDPLRTDVFYYQYLDFIESEFNDMEAAKQRKRQQELDAKRAEKEAEDRARWLAENLRQSDILKEKLDNKKEALKRSLDVDKNGEVDLIESSLLMPLIRKHQKKIQQTNADFIQNFIKLENHLKHRRQGVQNFYASLMSWELPKKGSSKQDVSRIRGSLKRWREQHERLSQEMSVYTAIQYNAIHMINAIVNDDMVTYYEVYEAFDELGLWHSNYEQLSIAQLNQLNDNVRRLIEVNIASTQLISKGLFDITERMKEQNHLLNNLEDSVREGFGDLSSSISSGLSEVHGALQAGNLLRMINTYQLYKVNKKLSD